MDGNKLHAGQTFSTVLEISKEMVEAFARATGDRNPIHFDIEAANRAGFETVIAPGDLVAPLVNKLIVREFPGILLLERLATYKRPVSVGSHVRIQAKLTTIASLPHGENTYTKMTFAISYFSAADKLCISSIVKALLITQGALTEEKDSVIFG